MAEEFDDGEEGIGVIKSIDSRSVAKICGGQVITQLATAVKELVENSLDAGASTVDVRMVAMGTQCIEVSDDGSGIAPENYAGLTAKYHTSKISSFSDVETVRTFGFRGEALSSLCEVCGRLTVLTRTAKDAVGALLTFDRAGTLVETKPTARQVGTTIRCEGLFVPFPVRRKELVRNIRRQFAKALVGLQSYALIATGVRVAVTHTPGAKSSPGEPGVAAVVGERVVTGGPRGRVLASGGHSSLSDVCASVLGADFLKGLTDLEVEVETPALEGDADVADEAEGATDAATAATAAGSGGGQGGSDRDLGVARISGLVSSAGNGVNKSNTDKQFTYLNGRPVDLPAIGKVMRECWGAYEMKRRPAFVVNLTMDPRWADINLTPDKREVLIAKAVQDPLLAALRQQLHALWEVTRRTFQVGDRGLGGSATLQSSGSESGSLGRSTSRQQAMPDMFPTLETQRTAGSHASSASGSGVPAGPEQSQQSELASASVVGGAFASPARRGPKPDGLGLGLDEDDEGSGGARLSTSQRRGSESPLLPSRRFMAAAGVVGPDPPTSQASRTTAGPPSSGNSEGAPESDGEGVASQLGLAAEFAHVPASGNSASAAAGTAQSSASRASLANFLPDLTPPRAGASAAAAAVPTPPAPDRPLHEVQVTGDASTQESATQRLVPPGQPAGIDEKGTFGMPGALVAPEATVASTPGSGAFSATLGDANGHIADAPATAATPTPPALPAVTGSDSTPAAADSLWAHAGSAAEPVPRAGELASDWAAWRAGGGGLGLDRPMTVRLADAQNRRRRDWASRLLRMGERRRARLAQPGATVSGMALAPPAKQRRTNEADGEESEGGDMDLARGGGGGGPAAGVELGAVEAEAQLTRVLTKEHFSSMRVVGQFNLGFIIGAAGTDLYILDQHACDEKARFETLRGETVLHPQPLIQARPLGLTAAEEVIVEEHLPVFERNGFRLEVRDAETSGRRVWLAATPFSRGLRLGDQDIRELCAILNEHGGDRSAGAALSALSAPLEAPASLQSQAGPRRAANLSGVLLPRVSALLASKACRSAIMVGRALNRGQMRRVVRSLSALDQPWNCPHGRPTLRHLLDTTLLQPPNSAAK